MNNCPNCGSKVNQGEAFCKVCGTKLSSPQNITNNTQQYQQYTNQNTNSINQLINYKNINNPNQNVANRQINNDLNSQQPQNNIYQNNIIYNNDSDNEYLIDSYIGKNAEKLKNGGFSTNTFFFGSLYVLYRKMWLLGFIWLAINITANIFLKSISGAIAVITNIIASTQFKKYYLKHVEERVDKIKSENPDKTKEQLIMICSQKGGTTLIPVIIAIIFYGITLYATLITILDVLSKAHNTNYKTPDTLDNLNITIPSNFVISNYSNDYYRFYTINYSEDENCSLKLLATSPNNYSKNAKEYLENDIYTDTYDEISQKKINNNTWYYTTVTTNYSKEYYYSIEKDDTIYVVKFQINSDTNKICSNTYNTIINSLEFK